MMTFEMFQVPETRSNALDSSIPALSLIKMRWVMLRGHGRRYSLLLLAVVAVETH